jgi:hypothetical protein
MKYLLFGLGLAGNYAVASHRQPTAVPPTVTLTLHPSLASIEAISRQLALPDLDGRLPARPNALSPVWSGDGSVALVGRTAVFHLRHTPQPGAITVYPLTALALEMVEIYLLGTVLAIYLELQGVAALHAAAAVVNEQVDDSSTPRFYGTMSAC